MCVPRKEPLPPPPPPSTLSRLTSVAQTSFAAGVGWGAGTSLGHAGTRAAMHTVTTPVKKLFK